MAGTGKLLAGKKALVFGVANAKSIAWAISEALHAEGAELGFTYLGEALEKRVRPLAESVGSDLILPCDVNSDEQVEKVFEETKKQWGKLDILIHCVAFANKDDLTGRYMDTSRDGFRLALETSAYSLVSMTQKAYPLLKESRGSVLALTFLGAERVIPHYNVMGIAKSALESSIRYLSFDLGLDGIRVNGISAGPIKTLAAGGISKFRLMLTAHSNTAPLGRNVTQEEVGASAVYLCSDMARGVTGEILHVDAGYSIMGMAFEEELRQQVQADAPASAASE